MTKNALLAFLEARSRVFWLVMGLLMVGSLGFLDYYTGPSLSLSLFYLIPIALGSWFSGRAVSVPLSVLSAIVWSLADALAVNLPSQDFVVPWNTLIRLGVFLLVAFLVAAQHRTLKRIDELSRTDTLTGALNGRAFFDTFNLELLRLARTKRPLTLANIDLDNFKTVNDTRGHNEGDKVLKTVVETMQQSLRRNDTIARMGGDEFALLLTETGVEPAHAVIAKLRMALSEAMVTHHWSVSFSIGVLTYGGRERNAEALLRQVDALMYEVKRSTKNQVRFVNLSDAE